MTQFVKMIFWEKKKIAISLYIMNYRTLYKKNETGIVSKFMIVCKNEHSSVANTFAQSVVSVFFWAELEYTYPVCPAAQQ